MLLWPVVVYFILGVLSKVMFRCSALCPPAQKGALNPDSPIKWKIHGCGHLKLPASILLNGDNTLNGTLLSSQVVGFFTSRGWSGLTVQSGCPDLVCWNGSANTVERILLTYLRTLLTHRKLLFIDKLWTLEKNKGHFVILELNSGIIKWPYFLPKVFS